MAGVIDFNVTPPRNDALAAPSGSPAVVVSSGEADVSPYADLAGQEVGGQGYRPLQMSSGAIIAPDLDQTVAGTSEGKV